MIEGIYLDGKTSKRVKARLVVLVSSNTINIQVSHDEQPSEAIKLEFSDLKIETRLGNTPREISFGDGQLFISEHNDAIDDLVKNNSPSKWPNILHKLESNLPLIVLATVTTLAIIWSAITIGIPKSAHYIAHQLPSFTTEQLGSGLDILDETVFDPTNLPEARQQHVLALVKPYLDSYQDLNPNFVFRSGIKANALALPDGHIVFTDDFVNLIQDDDELVSVLFHELGHLKHKHLLRRALQDSMITLMVIFITGDVDSIDLLTGLPTLILDLSYSREFEREADYFALEQLYKSDIDVSVFASAMKKLEDYYDEKDLLDDGDDVSTERHLETARSFLSTHPATEDRVLMALEFKKSHGVKE